MLIWFICFSSIAFPADVPKAPVPISPFLPVIYRYADTMLEKGRDVYGPQKTGLLLSALDRATLSPLTNRPAAPPGVHEGDRVGAPNRALTGANPQHDENLLRLLNTLSELSAKPKYRDAADGALRRFLQNAASPTTHEFFRPWLLWDRCHELAPQASKDFALGLWEQQIASPQNDSPRDAGFCLRTWATAYARSRDERFRKAIETVLDRFEQKRHPQTGWMAARTGSGEASVASGLSLAIDSQGAAHAVASPLAKRLRAFAAREDELFCALPHPLKTKGGFVSVLNPANGNIIDHTRLWDRQDGRLTTAHLGMMSVSRYENGGRASYAGLIQAAADAYLNADPAQHENLWPSTLGQAISLQVAAWRHTARATYMEQARRFGEFALKQFWGTNALPRASLKSDHYEAITGADTLALALVELHLNILHITAVRCPANTIDR